MIDSDGFRPNVGIILCNKQRQLFWAKRIGQDAWQFPQGGIDTNETPEEAMYRELDEEVGLKPHHVSLLGSTDDWLRYRLPRRYIRKNSNPVCIGQKQRWYLLRVNCNESDFCLDHSPKPEFDHWRWVKYWYPVDKVVYFKRRVYADALKQLAPLLFPNEESGLQLSEPRSISRRVRLYR
ncbi:MAG: RNA pyrophosphohydrolase [Gammaproteobacteria bacterium]|nr:RNA pyrophosphohydrolase [Gammaproteobacteria bacterium]